MTYFKKKTVLKGNLKSQQVKNPPCFVVYLVGIFVATLQSSSQNKNPSDWPEENGNQLECRSHS